MAVTSTTATQAASAASSTSSDTGALGKARLSESFDTFMKLLTTQVKNQDPLSPLDSNQFTQQLVQMTGVEQQLYTNDLLKKLVTNTGSGISTAVSLIGRDVKVSSADTNIQNGKATWSYNLARDAADVKLEIVDAKGKVVHAEAPTDNGAGDHSITWNGKDMTGTQLVDGGPYTLRVTAKDSTSTAVTSSVFIKGRVTGVEQQDGSTFITVNGARLPWEKVTSIAEAPTTTTTTTDTTTNSTPDTTA